MSHRFKELTARSTCVLKKHLTLRYLQNEALDCRRWGPGLTICFGVSYRSAASGLFKNRRIGWVLGQRGVRVRGFTRGQGECPLDMSEHCDSHLLTSSGRSSVSCARRGRMNGCPCRRRAPTHWASAAQCPRLGMNALGITHGARARSPLVHTITYTITFRHDTFKAYILCT